MTLILPDIIPTFKNKMLPRWSRDVFHVTNFGLPVGDSSFGVFEPPQGT